jgi:S-adenosylmethionine decarboxylase
VVWIRLDIDYQGNAYTVGPMNGDHWLLYLINPPSPTEEEIKDVKRGMTIGGGSKSISVTSDHRDHHHRDHDHDHDHHHHHHHHSHDSRQNGSYAAHGMDINIQRPSHAHQDQTLEILMTHLSADASAPFFHPPELDMNQASASGSSSTPASTAGAPEGVPRSGHYLGSLLTQHLGIDKLFDKDESIIDSFGFEPCGYSANGIIGSGSGYPSSSASTEVAAGTGKEQDQEGGGYWTIHVTPEEGWSFASFECNVPLPLKNEGLLPSGKRSHRPDLKTLIRRVVDIFEPGRLSITLFLSSESENALFNANNQSGDGTGNGSGNGTYSNPSESSSLADSGILADSGVLEPAHETEATRRAWTAFSKTLLGDAYVRKDRIGYEFEDYDLVFGCFEKRGFKRALKKAAPVQT